MPLMKKDDAIYQSPTLTNTSLRIEDLREACGLDALKDERALLAGIRLAKNDRTLKTPVVRLGFILNDLWLYYRMVISDSKVRVEQVLNDEQRKKFERILQEHQPR